MLRYPIPSWRFRSTFTLTSSLCSDRSCNCTRNCTNQIWNFFILKKLQRKVSIPRFCAITVGQVALALNCIFMHFGAHNDWQLLCLRFSDINKRMLHFTLSHFSNYWLCNRKISGAIFCVVHFCIFYAVAYVLHTIVLLAWLVGFMHFWNSKYIPLLALFSAMVL